jgi:hypothetical protein
VRSRKLLVRSLVNYPVQPAFAEAVTGADLTSLPSFADLLRYSEELSKPRRGITEIDPDKPDPVDGRSPVATPAGEQLKRTCVRLCGIAAYDQKDAQDLIRESGALVSVLGMCQINDANPSKPLPTSTRVHKPC